MIPSSVLNGLVVLVGCILACYLGSTLPEYEWFGAYLLGLAMLCAFCLVVDNFPLLLAVSMWTPFSLPIPMFASFPTFAIALTWVLLIMFFRICLAKSVDYSRSFNVFCLICFCWVPIRFLLSPIHKFGSSVAGGSGVSGLGPYFGYIVSFATLIFLGLMLPTRGKLVSFIRWQFVFCLFIGTVLLTCAFIPATAPYLSAMGLFAAGDLGDGIQRLVELPGYGLFVLEGALCPALIGLNRAQTFVVAVLAVAMIIVGGNRSAVAAALVAIPVLLLVTRKTNALAILICAAIGGIVLLHAWVDQKSAGEITPLVRSLGIFDSKIDEASGGNASAQWRYEVWSSGIETIMKNPIIGKGFGNLPEHVDLTKTSTDYEAVLAGGEAHNGFINASYGFGIPFMLAMTIALLLRTGRHIFLGFNTDVHDPGLREFHGLVAAVLASYQLLIYSASDLGSLGLWIMVATGITLESVTRTRRLEDGGTKARVAPSPIPKSRRTPVPDLS